MLAIGQLTEQCPQNPFLLIWLPFLSTFVEHHGFPSEADLYVQELYVTWSNLKGNIHGMFGDSPPLVLQLSKKNSIFNLIGYLDCSNFLSTAQLHNY